MAYWQDFGSVMCACVSPFYVMCAFQPKPVTKADEEKHEEEIKKLQAQHTWELGSLATENQESGSDYGGDDDDDDGAVGN